MSLNSSSDALLPWRRSLPHRHHIYLSFPASRTLQKHFPRPEMALREREQTAWLTGAMARELDMPPDALCFDYREDTLTPAFNVTAAQKQGGGDLINAGAKTENAGDGDYAGCLRITALYSLSAGAPAVSGLA
ncbi:fimbrial protein HofM [Citrobacter koseri]|uniref:Fimbrial protein HofM n=1 Tax=Citrobacter koseri TaxID=545 RepID=A0A2X2WM50_CITKO|nr:fimbrial protein HofM [Citrobacter koseri]